MRPELGHSRWSQAAGHRGFKGPEVWVTPAVNTDEPKGPEEKETRKQKDASCSC